MSNLSQVNSTQKVTNSLAIRHTIAQVAAQRDAVAATVIQRFFVGHQTQVEDEMLKEAIARSINPGDCFEETFNAELDMADGGFGIALVTPSRDCEIAFQAYGQTELGAVALTRLLQMDDEYIKTGWRELNGLLTEEGIKAYGKGLWRPFRVASNGYESDTVTPSGALMLPDDFTEEFYSTGDVANPLAILHHELMAHVLPLKEAEGLEPGREMELICIRFESEMLRELGLRERHLNWGLDDGTLNHTLHEPTERYYRGLVRYDEAGDLVEVSPESYDIIGPAIAV